MFAGSTTWSSTLMIFGKSVTEAILEPYRQMVSLGSVPESAFDVAFGDSGVLLPACGYSPVRNHTLEHALEVSLV